MKIAEKQTHSELENADENDLNKKPHEHNFKTPMHTDARIIA